MTEYLPFDDRPFRLRMGIRPLDLDRWIEVDDSHDEELVYKRHLIRTRYDQVVAVVEHPSVVAAQTELWDLVGAAAASPWVDDEAAQLPPIARCAGSTQEDWVLMVDLGSGPVLGAAGVCFPSRWVLSDKIGRTNRQIHQPVAHYAEHLGDPVDRFFERLTVDRPVWRLNWSLYHDPALFQPYASGQRNDALGTRPGAVPEVWLRIERQTLRRLPRSGAVAFGIRIHQRRVAELRGRPDVLARMAATIRSLPPDTFEYKDLGRVAEALLAWIDAEQVESGPRGSGPRGSEQREDG